MADIAINEKGEAVRFNGTAWEPAPIAENDKGERMIHNGKEWQPFPSSGTAPQGSSIATMAPNPQPQPGLVNQILGGIHNVAKFYADAYRNAPGDLVDVAKSTYNAFAHPVDTAQALGKVAAGLEAPLQMVKVIMPNGQTEYQPQPVPETDEQKAARIAPANALGEHYSQAYGSIPQALNTFRTKPISAAMDLSTIAMPAGGALARAPGVAGKVGGIVQEAGRMVDPLTTIGEATRGVGNVAENVGSHVLGGMTGMTARDVRASGRAGLQPGGSDAFWSQYTGKGDKAVPVELAESGLNQKIAEKNAEYRSGMHDVSQDRTILLPEDWNRIDSAVAGANEKGRFKGAVVDKGTVAMNAEIKQLVDDWKTLNPDSPMFKDVPLSELTAANFHTPEGIDALKRAVGAVRNSTAPNTVERVAANQAYNAVRKEIIAINPAYAKVMGKYSDMADEVAEIRKGLSLGEKASADTALGKLQSASRQTAQTRGRAQMVDELAKYEPDLPFALAGQNANALAPRGLVAKLASTGEMGAAGMAAAVLHNPAVLATLIPAMMASSPRLVGGAAYGGGRVVGGMKRGAEAIHLNPDTIRMLEQMGYQSGNNALAR